MASGAQRAFSSAFTASAVLASSHTTALPMGAPVAASQHTVVSRWFVIPTHATSEAANPSGSLERAASTHVSTLR